MFIERFIRYLQFEKRFSPHTVSAYQQDLQQFHEFLDKCELPLMKASHAVIRSFIVDLMERKCEAKTVNRKLSTLRSFYKFLLRDELINVNPMLQIKAPKVPRRLPQVIEPDKINSLLNSNSVFTEDFEGIRDKMIIELLFGTGMRLAELLTLKDQDIDRWNKTIRVFGKRRKVRLIPLNCYLLDILENYIAEREKYFVETAALVVTKEGRPAYAKLVYRVVKKYLSEVSTQEKKSPHVLRHSFATTLLNNGADLNAIKELLGHASLAATQVYTHNSVERLKSIYKQAHPNA